MRVISAWFFFRPGPSSPLPWVRDCVLQLAPGTQWRQKILLGLNLYGLDFANQGTEPILGGRYDDAATTAGVLYLCVHNYKCQKLHKFPNLNEMLLNSYCGFFKILIPLMFDFLFIGTLRFCVSTNQNFSGMNILQSIISHTRGRNRILIK